MWVKWRTNKWPNKWWKKNKRKTIYTFSSKPLAGITNKYTADLSSHTNCSLKSSKAVLTEQTEDIQLRMHRKFTNHKFLHIINVHTNRW